ncbi:MAG: hypothetical protein CL944_00525 [Candidatus Diapherotrites archaeon]|uniref:Uncharacterized protein n=1 Tax=Candidatus Iainarchaeum sp. TaxID=3101447 RepID=A0A2D6LP15_9ARCH|nr:hypothetical protein [Candidatus Diapherotrites archaeon]
MSLNPLENLLFSVIGLLQGSIIIAVPVFILVLFGQELREKIEEETKKSWVTTTFITTIIMVYILLLITYFFPFIIASQEIGLGEVPSIFAPDPVTLLISFIAGVLWVGVVTIVVSLLLMPFEFVGAYVHEVVSKKLGKKPEWLKLAITSYLTSVFASAIILFLVPEAITGVFYFLYYGF